MCTKVSLSFKAIHITLKKNDHFALRALKLMKSDVLCPYISPDCSKLVLLNTDITLFSPMVIWVSLAFSSASFYSPQITSGQETFQFFGCYEPITCFLVSWDTKGPTVQFELWNKYAFKNNLMGCSAVELL